jgi:uroporphyrinogen-III synthase
MNGATVLAGRTVLVTRPADQSGTLVDRLRRRGAHHLVAPTIRLAPARSAALTRALRELAAGEFDWIALTSRATARMLADRLGSPTDVRARVAAIGQGTADEFRRWSGRAPDLVATTFTTRGLARNFPRGAGRVLCARADVAPDGLEAALAGKGWTPTRVDAYRTIMVRSLPRAAATALRGGSVDAITFTSASTVRGFIGAAPEIGGRPKVVCIGPVTARQARELGLRVSAVASPHTVDGLVAALERALRPRRHASIAG